MMEMVSCYSGACCYVVNVRRELIDRTPSLTQLRIPTRPDRSWCCAVIRPSCLRHSGLGNFRSKKLRRSRGYQTVSALKESSSGLLSGDYDSYVVDGTASDAGEAVPKVFVPGLPDGSNGDYGAQIDGSFWEWKPELNVHYEKSGSGNVNSPPVLFLPGFGVGSFHYKKQLKDLGSDFRVWALDFLGQGRSLPSKDLTTLQFNGVGEDLIWGFGDEAQPWAKELVFSMDLWRDQVRYFIEEVIKEPVYIVGNSLGGFVALSLAARHPELVKGVTLLNATPFWTFLPNPIKSPRLSRMLPWAGTFPLPTTVRNIMKLLWQKISDPESIAEILKQVYADHSINVDEVFSHIMETTKHPAAAASLASIMFAPGSQLSFKEALSGCQENNVPICLVYGKEDPWVTPYWGFRVKRRMPEAPYYEISPAGHCPHDEVPEVVNFLLRGWIRSLESSGLVTLPLLDSPECAAFDISREVEFIRGGLKKSVNVQFYGSTTSQWERTPLMAEAVISALLEVLFEKIASLVSKEYGGPLGTTRKEMEKLQSVLSTIKAVLQDAEERQLRDNALKNWLLKLKDIFYDADDLVDEYLTELLRNQVISISHHWDSCCCVLQAANSLIFNTNLLYLCYKMKLNLKEIGDRLELVASERLKFHLRDAVVYQIEPFRVESDSYLLESKVFGRDGDERNIVKLLTEPQGGKGVSVISIVGIAGIGKTTVAKLAYHSPEVERYFDRRIWVCVAEGFNVKRLMKAIVESDTGSECNLVEMEAIQRRVQELIIGKRVLLVLDDVWDDDHEKYERLKNLIRNGVEGSKILITTRYEKVAQLMGIAPPYHLEGLSDDDCWSLFQERAYQNRKQGESSGLEEVGRQIAKKCGGVPLAAKALGSLMCVKNQKSQWLSVRDCEMWNLMGDAQGILPALRLGYEHLPPNLKQCFAYCSIFPKGYRINKAILINLWIAEGFIPSSVIGNEYFNELLWRSFFQNVTKDCEGNIVECQMHDLIHDLAKTVAGIDCLTIEIGKEISIPMGARHLSLICNETAPKALRALKNAKKLRSFLLLNGWRKLSMVTKSFFLSLKSVRALDFSGTRVKKISKSIATLLHLRYLNLSNTMLKTLPDSVCGLLNLESLILNRCIRLVELPEDMRNLVNLKHLDIYGCEQLTKLPRGIGKMKSLQTLPIYIVRKEAANDISELQSLDIGGELMIKSLENLAHEACAKNANLKEKRNLLFLQLVWGQGDEMKTRENVERVIEGLQPNSSLKKLHIQGYTGVNFPRWLMSPYLVNIVELLLIKCHRCSQLPPLGRLPFLEALTVDGMDAAMYFSNNVGEDDTAIHFASLKQLTLKNMPNLLGWSPVQEDSAMLCNLKKLTFFACPNLKCLPNLPSVDSLELHAFSNKLLEVVATKVATLSHLIISECPELECLPQGLLKNNKHLSSVEIQSCPKLQSLSSEPKGCSCSSLQSLSISNCGNLSSLRDSCGLQSLKSLSIRGCPSLSLETEMKGLNSLQFLSLSDCEELTTLPVVVQPLKSLQTLHLWSCPKLNSLPDWIADLSSLREFELWYCENLHSFPDSMKSLTQLRFLSIWGSPLLEVRCRKGEGEDWYKIQHVPFIKINGPYIQAMTGECSIL
nr:putative disease resistance protein RGA3 [Ipomoea batatas]